MPQETLVYSQSEAQVTIWSWDQRVRWGREQSWGDWALLNLMEPNVDSRPRQNWTVGMGFCKQVPNKMLETEFGVK